MPRATLAFGSNLGDKRANIAAAVAALDRGGTRILVRSSDYRTEPWGHIPQDWFVNACAVVETDLHPRQLLETCQQVERDLGRTREVKWGPRIIDVDILTYDDVALSSPELVLPHPHIFERAFVLVPLAEIVPDLEIAGRRIIDALRQIDCDGVRRLDVAR